MKRNLTVLVLLVTCSLLSISLFTSVVCAGELPVKSGYRPPQNDLVVEVTGVGDDGTSGDPGDAGDGYGIIDKSDLIGKLDGSSTMKDPILDEYLLILMSLIQLVL